MGFSSAEWPLALFGVGGFFARGDRYSPLNDTGLTLRQGRTNVERRRRPMGPRRKSKILRSPLARQRDARTQSTSRFPRLPHSGSGDCALPSSAQFSAMNMEREDGYSGGAEDRQMAMLVRKAFSTDELNYLAEQPEFIRAKREVQRPDWFEELCKVAVDLLSVQDRAGVSRHFSNRGFLAEMER